MRYLICNRSRKNHAIPMKTHTKYFCHNIATSIAQYESIAVGPLRSERIKQPKDKVLGQDIPGTSGTQKSGFPGQKLYASGLFRQEVAGMSRDLGRDVPNWKTSCKWVVWRGSAAYYLRGLSFLLHI